MNIYKRIGLIMLFFGLMLFLNNYVQEETFYGEVAKVLTVGCAGAFTFNFIRIVDERD